MTDLSPLIAKLEAATEGSRELDAEIWLFVTPGATRKQSSYIHKATQIRCFIDETRQADGHLIIVPHYTTSIDAALTLVPKSTLWAVGQMEDGPFCRLVILNKDGSYLDGAIESGGSTPALALCVAALKAREAQP